jgi:hypothetical protein
MQLELTADTLVFFIDDTGHEALPRGHYVYGLGGCGLMAPELDFLRAQWREVRRIVAGTPAAPLRASNLRVEELIKEHIETITSFFTSHPIARIAVTITTATKLHPDISTVDLVSKALLNRIGDIAKWTQFGRLAIVIESSERADPLLQQALSALRLDVDGAQVPADVYFMPKAAHEPALEVADFIVHTAGGQARSKLGGRSGFRLDYQAVFQSVDKKLLSCFHIDLVEKNEPIPPTTAA